VKFHVTENHSHVLFQILVFSNMAKARSHEDTGKEMAGHLIVQGHRMGVNRDAENLAIVYSVLEYANKSKAG
jgi:hypothetical protein